MNINEYAKLFGDYKDGFNSFGLKCLTADKQVQNGTVEVNDIGNAKAFLKDKQSDKWCLISGGFGNDKVETMMLGAVCGDVAGSVYEFNNIKHCISPDSMVAINARFTDDSVMTCAVAKGFQNALANINIEEIENEEFDDYIENEIVNALVTYGRKYPHAGYGGSFRKWLLSDEHSAYNSWGNGSAMRASYAGWVSNSMYEAEHFAELSAKVTHNHPEGIKGAKVVAGCIYILRHGGSKEDVAEYVNNFYDIDFTLDAIRPMYHFDVSCQGSVPQAVVAFLEGNDFSDVIAKAISIGGDSDTIAAIAGSIAEVLYPIPQEFKGAVIDKLDDNLRNTLIDASDFAVCRINHN